MDIYALAMDTLAHGQLPIFVPREDGLGVDFSAIAAHNAVGVFHMFCPIERVRLELHIACAIRLHDTPIPYDPS